MGELQASRTEGGDRLIRVLEWGLAAVLVLAPLPFGAVLPEALRFLELGSFLLLVVWVVRAARHPTRLPPLAVRAGLIGLLALALLQALPLGRGVVSLASPRAAGLRAELQTPPDANRAEELLLDSDPAPLERPATLSLDPQATASAARTGAALAALLLVATTVASVRGARLLALALLVSAAFQGLYGVLVLASGHDMIWHIPKKHYLDSATGTFVNRNHYAGYLNAALSCGLALCLRQAKIRRASGTGSRLVDLLSPEGSRTLLLGLLVVLGLSGLLLSFSRAGIASGLLALSAVVLFAGQRRLRTRLVLVLLLVGTAATPLSQLGTERLAERYARTAADLSSPGGRARVWADTLGMAGAHPLVGTGFGTFAAVYPLYRSAEVRLFYRHAHNDAIQALAEGGVVGGVFLLLVLLPTLGQSTRALRGAKGTLGVGVAAGLLALLIHSLVDFHFHMPANAAAAAILGGALLGLPWKRPG